MAEERATVDKEPLPLAATPKNTTRRNYRNSLPKLAGQEMIVHHHSSRIIQPVAGNNDTGVIEKKHCLHFTFSLCLQHSLFGSKGQSNLYRKCNSCLRMILDQLWRTRDFNSVLLLLLLPVPTKTALGPTPTPKYFDCVFLFRVHHSGRRFF